MVQSKLKYVKRLIQYLIHIVLFEIKSEVEFRIKYMKSFIQDQINYFMQNLIHMLIQNQIYIQSKTKSTILS